MSACDAVGPGKLEESFGRVRFVRPEKVNGDTEELAAMDKQGMNDFLSVLKSCNGYTDQGAPSPGEFHRRFGNGRALRLEMGDGHAKRYAAGGNCLSSLTAL